LVAELAVELDGLSWGELPFWLSIWVGVVRVHRPVHWGWMWEDLRELARYRELLATMVKRDLRVRYKNSVFGILWSFINPLMMTAVTYVVFTKFVSNAPPHYIVYYLAAYLPFTFMQSAILDSAQSILAAQPIVKKVYFPRELLPLSSVIGNFFHLLLGLAVLFLLLIGVYIHDPREFPIQGTVVLLPVVLLLTFMLALGLSLLVSALNTFYEDVKYMVSVLMYIMYFLCPVIYFIEAVANSSINKPPFLVYKLYNLNPIAEICILFRQIILAPPQVPSHDNPKLTYSAVPLDPTYFAACGVISVVVLVLGYWTFNRLKWKFMERP
jgi:lipopolysaccharide transport system permease protein